MACKYVDNLTGNTYNSKEELLDALKGRNKNTIEYLETVLKSVKIESDGEKYYSIDNGKKIYYKRVTEVIQNELSEKFDKELKYDTQKYIETELKSFESRKKAKDPKLESFNNLKEYKDYLEKRVSGFSDIAKAGTKTHKILELVINKNIKSLNELKREPEAKEAIETFENEKILSDFFQLALNFKKQLDLRYQGIKYKILTENRVFDEESKIAGTTDLLVLKEVNGLAKVDIIDFKFSVKDAEDWSRAKQKTVLYQQHMYRNIIRNMGINVDNMFILPFTFDIKNEKITQVIEDKIQSINNTEHSIISENVNQVIKNNINVNITKLKDNKNIYEFMEVFFNQKKEEIKESQVSDEQLKRFIEKTKEKGYWFNNLANQGENKKVIYKGTKEDDEKIKKYLVRLAEYRKKLSSNINKFIKETRELREKGSEDFGTIPGFLYKSENDEKVRNNLAPVLNFLWEDYVLDEKGKRKYLWEIVESKEAEDLDLLIARKINEVDGSNEVKIISITNKNLQENVNLNLTKKTKVLGKTIIDTGNTIGGNFFSKNKEKELNLLTATEGNIELIKAALFVLQNDRIFDGTYKISGLYAISENSEPAFITIDTAIENLNKLIRETSKLEGFTQPILSEELINKKRLFADIYRSEPLISLIEYYSMLASKSVENSQLKHYKTKSNSLKNILSVINEDIKSGEVGLRQYLEQRQIQLLKAKDKLTTWELEELKIVSEAILGLYNISDCYEELDLTKFVKEMETADNIAKKPFKILRDLYNKARYNLTEKFKQFSRESQPVFKQLYKSKSILETDIIGLHKKAFENLFEYTMIDGKKKRTMRFRDINDKNYEYNKFGQTSLTKEEKEVLKMFFNMKRDLLINKYGEANEEAIRDIPLVFRKDLEYIFKELKEKGLKETIQNKMNVIIQDVLNQDNIAFDKEINLKDKLRISDLFRYQESENHREILLETNDDSLFEDDIEFLYYLYAYQYYKAKEYNKVMPGMLAVKTLVNFSSHYWFKKDGLTNISELIDNYFTGAVFGKRVINDELKETAEYAQRLKNTVSTILQGVSPGTGAIQFLTSLWGTLSAVIGKYSDRVSFNSFLKAGQLIIGKQSLSFDNINFLNYLAEDYRIHGLEPENLLYHFGETNKGILGKRGALFNSRWMMWFTMAPDRFFRTLWFLAENIEKGVIKVDKFGIAKDSALQWNDEKKTIEYFPELDDRFKDYFKNGKNYEEHKAKYEYFIKDLQEEGLFIDGKPLKAWTEKEIRTLKKIASNVFAETSEETKSSFERSIFGILFTQFKRWIYAKRELYLKNPSLDEETGNWEIAKDEDGNLIKDSYGNYVRIWQGRQQEGILNTLWFITKEIAFYRNLSAIKKLEPDQLRNLKHLASDIILFSLILATTKGLFDDEKDRDTLTKLVMRYLYNSGKDLLFVNTVWNLGTETSPFVTTSVLNTMVNDVIGNALTGEFDKSGEALFRTIGVTRLPYQLYKFSKDN